jgi:hypothetical protein
LLPKEKISSKFLAATHDENGTLGLQEHVQKVIFKLGWFAVIKL